MKKDIIIIGAGLSGLYAAFLLQDKFNITILEARDRIGGRILTVDGHDLGPSWIWPHQKQILSLISFFGLELFKQHTDGDSMYESTDVQRFTPPPSMPSARIVGGIDSLVQKIYERLSDVKVVLECKVTKLEYIDDKVEVISASSKYKADFVLNTLAPRLSAELEYIPSLGLDELEILQSTPTWMGQSKKVVIEYKEDFWRNKNLSGAVFSHKIPLSEVHDASTKNKAALFGFVSAKYNMSNIKEDSIKQLVNIFGDDAKNYTHIYVLDWTKEMFSSSVLDKESLSSHPMYGYSIEHFNSKLKFIGTESSYDNGGYLEGAIISAQDVAKKLLLIA